MEEEKKFEKKSTKKVWIIIAAIVLIAALAVGVYLFVNNKKKPENVMKQAVENVFDFAERKGEEINSERVTLELTADLDSNDAEIKALNPIIKAFKLKATTEFDIKQDIFNENITAYYDDDEVISADALIQEERLYVFLNNLYSKYIEVLNLEDVKEIIEDELGEELDLNALLNYSNGMVDEKLLDDIEKIILDKISSTETTQEKTELNGKKVTETKMKLTLEDTVKLLIDILKKENEYLDVDGFDEMIEELEDELEYADFDSADCFEFTVYTTGVKDEIVNFTVKMKSGKETLATIKYNEENDKKSSITVSIEGVMFGLVITEDGNKTTMEFVINPFGESINNAITFITATVTEENENEGLISYAFDFGKIMAFAGEDDIDLVVNLNIKYKVEPNAEVEARNISKKIKYDDMTDADYEEIYNNLQENEFLFSLLESVL